MSKQAHETREEILKATGTAGEDSGGGAAEAASHQHDQQPNNKRPRRTYLNFSGHRHTRVGRDYQVTVLPPPPAHGPQQPVPAVPVELSHDDDDGDDGDNEHGRGGADDGVPEQQVKNKESEPAAAEQETTVAAAGEAAAAADDKAKGEDGGTGTVRRSTEADPKKRMNE